MVVAAEFYFSDPDTVIKDDITQVFMQAFLRLNSTYFACNASDVSVVRLMIDTVARLFENGVVYYRYAHFEWDEPVFCDLPDKIERKAALACCVNWCFYKDQDYSDDKMHYLPEMQGGRKTPAVVVLGARQVGKSTLVKAIMPGATVFDLEKRGDYQRLADDPELIFKESEGPFIFDEAQLLPPLFNALRVEIDRHRQKSRPLQSQPKNSFARWRRLLNRTTAALVC